MIGIEAHVMMEMAERQDLPAVAKYAGDLAGSYENMAKLNLYNDELKEQISALSEDVSGILRANRELARQFSPLNRPAAPLKRPVPWWIWCVREWMPSAVCDDAETHVDSACLAHAYLYPISCIVYNPGEIYLTV